MRSPVYGNAAFLAGRAEPFSFRTGLQKLTRVLWVCRASVVSVALGVGFAFVGQVHDLYLDMNGVAAPAPLAHPLEDLWPPLRDALVFGLLTTFFWALPVHAVARLAVSEPAWLGSPFQPPEKRDIDAAAGRFDFLATWVPRALGLICYFAAFGAGVFAWMYLPIEATTALGQRSHNEIVFDLVGLGVFAVLYVIYVVFRRRLYQKFQGEAGPAPGPRIGLDSDEGGIGRRFDLIVTTGVLVALAIILFVGPVLDWFQRLWLVPLLLGVWTPLLGLVARWGYAVRAPLGLAVFVALVTLIYVFGDNHDSDLIAHAPAARSTFKDAATKWMAANHCSGADCPSPIVVLVSGGASRSAFFAESVLGLLTDASCEKPGEGRSVCAVEPAFARQVFAISSVSGGSVAAVVYARALVDGRKANGYAPPCKPKQDSSLYFRDGETANWRGCLQKIVSEDFLSPVIAGLGFRDVFSFAGEEAGRDVLPDRGRRIEAAISAAYLHYVGEKPGCRAARDCGLEAPLSSFAEGAEWTPKLLLNSTSSESGKRMLFSGIAPNAPHEGGRWLQDAYDFHETVPGADISLVAAAHDSARFPVISPAGALRSAGGKHNILTKVVDGGYFENYGASTAFDLALALKGVGLDPFVLLIANDPKLEDSAGWETADTESKPGLKQVARSWVPPLISAPVGAVLATEEARGEGALTELQRELLAPPTGGPAPAHDCLAMPTNAAAPCFAFVSVRKPDPAAAKSGPSVQDRIEGVSMSWWLSKPVQVYLDNQLELPRSSEPGGAQQRALVSRAQGLNAKALKQVCAVLAGADVARTCEAHIQALAHD